MQTTAPIVHTAARIETPSQTPQNAPMPLDLEALRHVVGGGPGGSWSDAPGGSW